MIASLRARHRRTFYALAVVLPALLTSALALRDPAMGPPAVPSPPGDPVRGYGAVWKKYAVEAQLRRSGDQRQLAFSNQLVNEPDVLVYLVGEGQDIDSATLLGRYAPGVVLELPAAAPGTSRLLLYSGARGQILDETILELSP